MPLSRIHYTLILLLLIILAVLGNYFTLPLFFGVDFIFGSIAVMSAIRIIGVRGAFVVALIAGSYTYFIWGHLYAMVIFTIEALVVGILWKRKIMPIALGDILFWLVLGMPLVVLFYSGVMDIGTTPTFMIALKQAVNGIANTIIATYLVLLIPQRYILKHSNEVEGKIQINELLFTILLGVSLIFSFIIVSFENKLIKESLETGVSEQLEIYHSHLQHEGIIDELTADYKARAQHNDKFNIMVFSSKVSYIDIKLPFTNKADFSKEGSIREVNGELSLWVPERNDMPLMLWWTKGFYFIKRTLLGIDRGQVYVLLDTRTVIDKIQKNILIAFQLLLFLIIAGSITSYLISRSLTITIVKLMMATKNLPGKLKNNDKVVWPNSTITELLQLSRQAEAMSHSISSTFDDVNLQANTILESSIDGIITIDDKGNILGFNPAAEKLFGYKKDDVLSKNIDMLIPKKYKKTNKEYFLNRELNNKNSFQNRRVEVLGLHKSGKNIEIEVSISRTKFKNKSTYTGIITDITERKESDALKRDFISTVSHELRTPLTSINGAVKIFQARKDAMSEEERDSLLDVTDRNVMRLTELINDLLDFEKLESSGVEYLKEEISAATLIKNIIRQNESFAKQKSIQLQENIATEYKFIADSQRVSQIILNLVSNAIKFSPENEVVEIGCEEIKNKIKIYVKDYGDGIDDEYKKHIFERFTQADSSDIKKIQRGTGLGLAIAKRMTEDMGGEIGFKSTLGKGSTFFITYPLHK